jgi:hypothetical protein
MAQDAPVDAVADPAEPAAPPEFDVATVLAIGATTYVTASLVHEGVGHEIACAAAGGRPMGFSTAVAGCDEAGMSPGDHRFLTAGGAGANLLWGGSHLALLYAHPPEGGAAYYYLWLTSTVNLLEAGGYMMVGPWVPVGDFGAEGFLRDVENPVPLQIGLSALGTGITFGSMMIANDLGKPLWGSAQPPRLARKRLLSLTPYLAGSALVTGGALLSRAGPEFAVSAGVSTFAGTLFLAYLPLFFNADVFEPSWTPATDTALPIRRRPAWWAVGAIAVVVGVAVMGPGIGEFDEPHPFVP